jgi:hypothetical protein
MMLNADEIKTARLLSRKEAAMYVREFWGMPLSPNTLAKLAVIGGGPLFRKAGKFPLYEKNDLDCWVGSRIGEKQSSTSHVFGIQVLAKAQP